MLVNTYSAVNVKRRIALTAAALGRSSYALLGTRGGAMTAWVGGVFYTIGGYNGSASVKTTKSYDPATNSWTSLADKTTAVRIAAVCVVGTKIHCIGGIDVSTIDCHEVYDTVANTWASKSLPGANSGGVAAYVNGLVYLIGGSTAGAHTSSISTVKSYDPTNDAGGWTTRASLSGNRWVPAVGVIGGKIYIAEGQNSSGTYLNTVEEYNPSGDSWTGKANSTRAARYVASAVFNNCLYVLGGTDGTIQAWVRRYDPAANSWTDLTAAGTAFYLGSAAASDTGLILHVGGVTGAGYADINNGFIDYQGVLVPASYAGACSGSDSVKNHTSGSSGTTVSFAKNDQLGFLENAWNTAPAARSSTMVES